MNAKYGLWIMVAILSIVMACNYTEGDCYPVGQADGPAAADVGAGVGSGAGGYGSGDAPRSGGTGANACNAADEQDEPTPPSEESLKVFCFKKDWGYPCADKCAAKGLACSGKAYHPKGGQGPGELWACNDVPIGVMCSYHYPDGSDCFFWLTFGAPRLPWCAYSGDGQN